MFASVPEDEGPKELQTRSEDWSTSPVRKGRFYDSVCLGFPIMPLSIILAFLNIWIFILFIHYSSFLPTAECNAISRS